MLEILNELKKGGFNGHLKIDGYGVIEYDREQGCFVELSTVKQSL